MKQNLKLHQMPRSLLAVTICPEDLDVYAEGHTEKRTVCCTFPRLLADKGLPGEEHSSK